MKYAIVFLLLLLSTFCVGQIMVKTITDEFDGSGGLNMGNDGKLYVANFGMSLDNGTGKEIWTIDYKNGGQPELFAFGLNGASGNDFDSEGILFQSNIAAGTISKVTPNGIVSLFVSNGISCNVGINIDSDDNLYVCNCCGNNGNTIRKVSKEGNSTLFSSSPLLSCPNGITRDKNDNLYVSNFSNGNIVKIDPNGLASLLAVTPGISGISAPSNGHIMYSEKENVLYVASHGSHRIYKLTLNGELSVIAGSGERGNDDGLAADASFSRPNGLAMSEDEDTLFVNSSIPTTDANGRPLNPSVVRMITGIRGLTSVGNSPELSFNIVFDPSANKVLLKNLSHSGNLNYSLLTSGGNQIDSGTCKIYENRSEIPLKLNIVNGLYFINIESNNGKSITKKIMIYK